MEDRMKFQQIVILAVATMAMGSFTTQALANSCGDVSPLMTSLGDQYIEMTDRVT